MKAIKHSGFTITELIFIIIILGILAGGAVMNMPDNRLLGDINFVTANIKQKQMQALTYDLYDFNNPSWRNSFDERTCIDTALIQADAKNPRKHHLKSSLSAAKICFDSLGRPYHDNYQLNNLLKMPILLHITYKNHTKKITIMPYSGSIMIGK